MPSPPYPILLVDDEVAVLESERLVLALNGMTNVVTCADGRGALEAFERHPVALAILDVSLPDVSGLELLERIGQDFPGIDAIMLTALDDLETAVACIRRGALDYLVKPVDQHRLMTTIRSGLELRESRREVERLRQRLLDGELERPELFEDIVTCDRQMLGAFRYVEAIAPTSMPVLVTGETGVGKELFALAVHRASGRGGPFVCVNTAGIDDALFSDTLFGHVPGAFTGAHRERPGLVEKAARGTIFLDEVGDLRPESQVKLLRLLQEGTYYPLGSENEERSSARVVTATNRTLGELQADPSFRKDLFYRLKSHHLHVPALRDRRGDLPLLLDHFLAQAAREQHKSKPAVPPELLTVLANHAFPGNVRELQGMVFEALALHSGSTLSCASFKKALGLRDEPVVEVAAAATTSAFPTPLPTAREVELQLVEEALRRTQGNRKLAAELIGMARETFRSKLVELERRRGTRPDRS